MLIILVQYLLMTMVYVSAQPLKELIDTLIFKDKTIYMDEGS